MTMNDRDFARVLQQVGEKSSRTYPEFVNGQALRLASFAEANTERADASRISAQLGQVSSRFINKRSGKRLKTAKKEFSSKASLDLYRIVNWRRARANKKPLGNIAMSKPARKIRAAAIKSTAYIASGWIWSIRQLSKAVGYRDLSVLKSSTKISGKAKGYAQPAQFTVNGIVTCTIANTSLLAESARRTGSRPGKPMRIAERGLATARDLTAKDMLKHLADKLQPVLNKFSAK